MPKWINNLALSPKLLASIIVMMILSGVISYTSYTSLHKIIENSKQTELNAQRQLAAGRATANLLMWVRSTEFLPLELSDRDRKIWEDAAEDERKRLIRRIDWLDNQIKTDEGSKNIAEIRKNIEAYTLVYKRVVTSTRQDNDLDAATKAIIGAVPITASTRKELRDLEDRFEQRMKQLEQTSLEVSSAAFVILMIATFGGGALGLALALWIVVFGVVRPLQRMTAAMQDVANGNADASIPSLGQKDEVGKLALALESFKLNLKESRRLQAAEAQEMEIRRSRTEAVEKLIDTFRTDMARISNILMLNTDRMAPHPKASRPLPRRPPLRLQQLQAPQRKPQPMSRLLQLQPTS